jgi:hypothetical protein
MRKPIRSKLAWLFLGLLPLLLIACSGGTAPEATAPAADEPDPPTVEPTIEEIQVEEVMEEVEAEIEEEVMPVSAKPQLIEFYADW